ncbi:MAG TPA: hypothetical protein VGF84_24510 [Micromonosporaceae bacterium]
MSVIRQLSLFGTEAAAPGPEDLAGLLAGPGQVVRMGGTARVSVVVEERWRAAALVAEMRLRGLSATCVSTVDEHYGVRTPYSSMLAGLASAWLYGAVKLPPPGFALEGRRLRLWVAAAGYRDALGVSLRIGRCEEPVPKTLQRALATLGLASDIVGVSGRAGGPSLRISGRRRVARFAELIGDPPANAPAEEWP